MRRRGAAARFPALAKRTARGRGGRTLGPAGSAGVQGRIHRICNTGGVARWRPCGCSTEHMRYTHIVLEPVAPDLWVVSQPLRFFGLQIGSRMTVVRLASGGLVLHSPVRWTADLAAAVDALGRVIAIVAPTKFHHLSVSAWAERYASARVLGCPGLLEKREDLSWDAALTDTPDPLWAGELDQVHFAARSLEDEVVLYHRASQTMICADAMFNFCGHSSRLTRTVGAALGLSKPGAGHLERVLIRQREAARVQVDRMLEWRFDRMIVGHGPVLAADAKLSLEQAYAWL